MFDLQRSLTLTSLLTLALSSTAYSQDSAVRLIQPFTDPACRVPVNSTYDGAPTLPDGSPSLWDPKYYLLNSTLGEITWFRNADFANATPPAANISPSYMVWWKIGEVPASCRVVMFVPYSQNHYGHTNQMDFPQPPGLMIWTAGHRGCMNSQITTSSDVGASVCCGPQCAAFATNNAALQERDMGVSWPSSPVKSQKADEYLDARAGHGRRLRPELPRKASRYIEEQFDAGALKRRQASDWKTSGPTSRQKRGKRWSQSRRPGIRVAPNDIKRTPQARRPDITSHQRRSLSSSDELRDLHHRQANVSDPSFDLSQCKFVNVTGPWAEAGYQTMVSSVQTCASSYLCSFIVESTVEVDTSVSSERSQSIKLKDENWYAVSAGKVTVIAGQTFAKTMSTVTGREQHQGSVFEVANRLGQPPGTTGFVTFTPSYDCYSGNLDCGAGPSPSKLYTCYPSIINSTLTKQVQGEYGYVLML